jgi:hypothetical protein
MSVLALFDHLSFLDPSFSSRHHADTGLPGNRYDLPAFPASMKSEKVSTARHCGAAAKAFFPDVAKV